MVQQSKFSSSTMELEKKKICQMFFVLFFKSGKVRLEEKNKEESVGGGKKKKKTFNQKLSPGKT